MPAGITPSTGGDLSNYARLDQANAHTAGDQSYSNSGTQRVTIQVVSRARVAIGDSAHVDVFGHNGEFLARREGGGNATARLSTYGVGSNYIAWDRLGGTVASPTATESGMVFGTLVCVGWDGVDAEAMYHCGFLRAVATETHDGTGHGTKWELYAVPVDSTTETLHTTHDFNGSNPRTSTGEVAATKRITHGVVNAGNTTGTYAADTTAGNEFRLTLTGDTELSNPTGVTPDGQGIVYRVKQDATGGRAITFDTKFRFRDGATPTLGTTASKTTYIGCVYVAADDKWDVLDPQGEF